jgi:hypothetical protein
LEAIEQSCDLAIASEYDHQYWGFETQEEWETFQVQMANEDRENFYIELLKYLQGKPNDIEPGTVGMDTAEIAKTLVEKDPALLLAVNKDKLLNETLTIYDARGDY